MAMEKKWFVGVLYIFTVLYSRKVKAQTEMYPFIDSLSLMNMSIVTYANNEYFRSLLLEMVGKHFYKGMDVRFVSSSLAKGSECVNDSDSVVQLSTSNAVWFNDSVAFLTVTVPEKYMWEEKPLYVCLSKVVKVRTSGNVVALNDTVVSTFGGEVIKWIHQGEKIVILINGKAEMDNGLSSWSGDDDVRPYVRKAREARGSGDGVTVAALLSSGDRPSAMPHVLAESSLAKTVALSQQPLPKVLGIRVEHAAREPFIDDEGIPNLLAGSRAVLRLFGSGFTNHTFVTVTPRPAAHGELCEFPIADVFQVDTETLTNVSVLVKIRVPQAVDQAYYVCIKDLSRGSAAQWIHQGDESWIAMRSYEKLLPMWVSILIIVVCLTFSALFSGLNLGLMSMDQTDLKIVANTGSEAERRYAQTIMPVRKTGNYLLCSILLGNVLVNSTLTILMDDLTSGLVAVIASTLAIVIFGEICPQAICSRYGLAVGAKTIYITRLVMLITFPLSFPISKLLDRILGVELGNVYNRERLKELVKLTTEYNDLEKDEVNIISGALELKKKIVGDVMTKLEDAYMLALDSVLDFETVSEIMKQGYSRIPVYDGVRSNIVTVLYIKDLAFVDPDDNTPLQTLCKFYQNPCNFVFEDTTLDVMFKQFKEGIKGHMAFVHRVNSEGEGDPFYETIGLITLEDVIEELIQAEIVDETDVWTDNRSKRRRKDKTTRQDFTVFAERRENQRIHISPQLTLATFQYLSTAVDAFKPDIISETILRRLLKQDIIYHVKVKNKEKAKSDPQTIIYSQGKAVDYFVLILEGRVEVTIGKENMTFESGPFTYFGTQALVQNIGVADSPTSPTPQNMGSLQSVNLDSMLRHTFVPDYTVRAITEVFYIRIKRSLYLAAKRATLMERAKKDNQAEEHFDDEVEKLLHSLDEDDRSQGPMDSPTLNKAIKDVSNNISQKDKETIQQCILAAEQGTDVAALPSLTNSSISVRSPTNGPVSPSRGVSPSAPLLELNGSLCGAGESTGLEPLLPPQEEVKTTKEEERTVLLPQQAQIIDC